MTTTPVPKVSMHYDPRTRRAVYRRDDTGRELGLDGVTREQAERFTITACEMLAVDCRMTTDGADARGRPRSS